MDERLGWGRGMRNNHSIRIIYSCEDGEDEIMILEEIRHALQPIMGRYGNRVEGKEGEVWGNLTWEEM